MVLVLLACYFISHRILDIDGELTGQCSNVTSVKRKRLEVQVVECGLGQILGLSLLALFFIIIIIPAEQATGANGINSL